MDFRPRKLLYIQENDPTLPVPQSVISSNTTTSENSNQEHYILNSYRTNPPFDSSMALTILLLFAALCFMGFFTIYIRRLSEDYRSSEKKGLDRKTLESIPVYVYDGDGGSKEMIVDCAICLSEFEKGDRVKAIPFCGHVFHGGCIDTWLESHVTCPLCRSLKLFPEEEEVAIQCDARPREAVGSTAELSSSRD